MLINHQVTLALLGLFALVACTDRSFTPVTPGALDIGTPVTILAATTRAKQSDGSYGYERSETLQRLELTVSVPPAHTPGDLQYAYARPNPKIQFTMAARDTLDTPGAFRARIDHKLRALPKAEREVLVFVHGYNETQAEAVFRAAQLSVDSKIPGATVVYSWPSQGKTLGYAYDIDSALFARDGLEQLLFELNSSVAQRIVLVAHSMGSLVVMETLRQIDLHKPGWVGRNIGGVLLISPDLDVELFRSQMKALSKIPQPFVVFVSAKDRVLNLSSRIRGGKNRERLGTISGINEIAEFPIEIIDTTAFSDDAGSAHFVAGSSPALLALLKKARSVNSSFGPDTQGLDFLLPGNLVRKKRATRLTVLPQEAGR